MPSELLTRWLRIDEYEPTTLASLEGEAGQLPLECAGRAWAERTCDPHQFGNSRHECALPPVNVLTHRLMICRWEASRRLPAPVESSACYSARHQASSCQCRA